MHFGDLGFLKLDRESVVPLYQQLAAQLEDAIHEGLLAPGSMLKPEVEIGDALNLSRPTVRRAIQSLADKGMLTRTRGIGTQVSDTVSENSKLSNSNLKFGVIGLIVPDSSNPFFSEIAQAIQQNAWQRGLLTIWADSNEIPETERAIIHELSYKTDGMILVSPRLDDMHLVKAVSGRPCVTINRALPGIPHVQVDITTGMRQAAAHLSALGHTAIGYVGGPPLSRSDRLIQDTLRKESNRLGFDFSLVDQVRPTHEGGYSAADQVKAKRLTAIVAHNDLVAIGLISRLTERGLLVPDDISVIGTDNIPFSSMLTPSLTTVAIDRRSIGVSALSMLGSLMKGESLPNHEIISSTQLVVRQTTSSSPR